MTSLAVITPSWRPDIELFDDLRRSVLEFLPPETTHHVIVPWAHRAAFRRYQGETCRIWSHPELLPRRFIRTPGGIWINTIRPWPPVRGWIMQQAAKIAVAGLVDADLALLVDSDVVFVRPVSDRFTDNGVPRFYRSRGVIDECMPRHVLWHKVARELLGLPAGQPPPLDDYVSPVGIWEPAKVRALQRRIAEITGRPWEDAFTGRLHVSEFIVYGLFVDEVLGTSTSDLVEDTTICHNCWDREPLNDEAARRFAFTIDDRAVAVMISSHSRTEREVRRAAARNCRNQRDETTPTLPDRRTSRSNS